MCPLILEICCSVAAISSSEIMCWYFKFITNWLLSCWKFRVHSNSEVGRNFLGYIWCQSPYKVIFRCPFWLPVPKGKIFSFGWIWYKEPFPKISFVKIVIICFVREKFEAETWKHTWKQSTPEIRLPSVRRASSAPGPSVKVTVSVVMGMWGTKIKLILCCRDKKQLLPLSKLLTSLNTAAGRGV